MKKETLKHVCNSVQRKKLLLTWNTQKGFIIPAPVPAKNIREVLLQRKVLMRRRQVAPRSQTASSEAEVQRPGSRRPSAANWQRPWKHEGKPQTEDVCAAPLQRKRGSIDLTEIRTISVTHVSIK